MYFRHRMTQENLAGRTIASYRLIKRVGEGGTATVYRAEHPDRGVCAVKILRQRARKDPTAVKRFLREAGYGSRVTHPNVVRTYDFGEEDGLHYLALEWAEGRILSEYVAEAGPLAMDVTAEIIAQLADALAAAHQAGIVHRDLKPENIMFDPETRTAKLLDFGIARDAQDDASERLTRTGFFVGSLNYVAPEALSGALVDERADIYSLATIAYFLLTQRFPYSGRSPRELFQQLLTEDPTPLNQVSDRRFPKAVEAVIMKSLARDPGDRHGDVRRFAADLRDAGTGADLGRHESASTGGLLNRLKGLFGKR